MKHPDFKIKWQLMVYDALVLLFVDLLLLVLYQPVYHRDTGRFDSAEALIRLSDDQDQPISPAEFIPVAEENGLIDALS